MQEEIGDQRVLQKLKSPAAITPIPRQSILRFHGSRHTLSKPKVDSMAVGAVASRSQAILRHSFSSRDSSHDLYPELHPGDLDGNVIEADECYGCRKIRDLSSIGRDTVSGPESIVSSSNGDCEFEFRFRFLLLAASPIAFFFSRSFCHGSLDSLWRG